MDHFADPSWERLRAWDRYLRGPDSSLGLEGNGVGEPPGWFLGPQAENEDLLLELVKEAIASHCSHRREFYPNDPKYINEDVKNSKDYQKAVERLRSSAKDLFTLLKKSLPISSMRYQGHMLWDQVLPGMVGYFAAMLYNQNNVAAEASPVTTQLEIDVGDDLCKMLGFSVPPRDDMFSPRPWGHITCGGTVANIEALWAARNLKFFPIALKAALINHPSMERAKGITVNLANGANRTLVSLDEWDLLNLKIDDVADLPYRIEREYKVKKEVTAGALLEYALQHIGIAEFYRRYIRETISAVVLAPASCHYSWPKAGTLLGLGQNSIRKVRIDTRARLDVSHLTECLEECLNERVPVIAVVVVIGSTEQSSVDPLDDILSVRNKFREKGLDFAIHCDAAWGGYFNTMLREEGDGGRWLDHEPIPVWQMSEYVERQYRALRNADSITVDPHKAGYVPYPAGSLCYKNSAMRDVISLAAPVIYRGGAEPTVGIYGIEGSKPGAAAAAVWLSHKVIRPTRSGYGKILGQCMWTSKRMYCRLLSKKDKQFQIIFFQKLPAEINGADPEKVKREKEMIASFVDQSNTDLVKQLEGNKEAARLFGEMGSDQVILAYAVNFFTSEKTLNPDAIKLNKLNHRVFEICSLTEPKDPPPALILTSSNFDPAVYGQEFVDEFCIRLGVKPVEKLPINFLISTTMDPWTTDTPDGDFLKTVDEALTTAVYQALKELEFDVPPKA